ncbi:MAG: DUF480 domain-containing protein [Desulfobulbaceae bacterium]|nr:DUF480 domain-containing protein [Desulfobulbaceae bacterium]
MDYTLSKAEARVLGSLMEKEMTTPEYYPLSLKALTAACNQKSNREPVMELDEVTVVRGLDGLKEKRLVTQSDASRVPKYEEIFFRRHKLVSREMALLSLLLLRGAQTVGELRGRSERMYAFTSLEETEEVLENLAEMGFLKKLARMPGHKECRYVHLLSGEVTESVAVPVISRPEDSTLLVRAENERLADLERELIGLREELAELRQAFSDFRAQFD